MDCEICGKTISKLKQVVIDGNTFFACEQCASFGKEKAEAKAGKGIGMQGNAGQVPFSNKEFDLGLEITPDFGKRILQARQAKGMTTKELAMKIFEKESLVHRIEHQGIKPSDALIKKLEKELGITLKNKEE
jgi:putative transcription factor